MAKALKIEISDKGIQELLHSKELEQGLKALAEKHAGEWATDTKQMPTRVIASIYTLDQAAIEEELDTHRLVGGLR